MVDLFGTGKGNMKFGVLYKVHPNLVDKIVANGFATIEKQEVIQEKKVELKKKKKNEENN